PPPAHRSARPPRPSPGSFPRALHGIEPPSGRRARESLPTESLHQTGGEGYRGSFGQSRPQTRPPRSRLPAPRTAPTSSQSGRGTNRPAHHPYRRSHPTVASRRSAPRGSKNARSPHRGQGFETPLLASFFHDLT